MEPKKYWTVALVLLALFALLNLLGTVYVINEEMPNRILDLITVGLLALFVIALILVIIKNRAGFYLSLALPLYYIGYPLYGLFLLLTAEHRFMPISAMIPFFFVIVLVPPALGIALIFCTWKSKPVFEATK